MAQTNRGKDSSVQAKQNAGRNRPFSPLKTAMEPGDSAASQSAWNDPLSASPGEILQLQRQYGNRATKRLIQRAQAEFQRQESMGLEGGEIEADVQTEIESERGGGQPLDKRVGEQVGEVLGADLDRVRVHTDSKSNALNQSLSSKAFTTGSDVFFSQGAYAPGTPGGKSLLAHELTHVVQQGGGNTSAAQRQYGVIQRKAGLPNKAEAIARSGKAGFHFGFGKTTWGKFLQHLDEFRALADTDKAGQAQKLAQIQSDMDAWLNSPQRQTVKTGDPAKEALIGELRGKVKVLYFEAKTKEEVFDPISVDAQSNSAANRQRIKAQLLLAHLDDSVQAIDNLLTRLRAAKLTTNLAPNTLGFYSKAGDFKNAFQTMYKDKSPGGVLKPIPELGGVNLREAAERYLGYSPFTEEQRENRPHYCGINIFNNPKGAAPSYGRFYFVWNDAVKARATYTAFDTFKMIKDAPMKDLPSGETIGTTANIEATIAFNENVLLTLAKIDQAVAVSQKELENKLYIEAVVHGGLSMDDCDELVVDYKDDTTDPLELGDKQFVDTFHAKYPNIPIRYKT